MRLGSARPAGSGLGPRQFSFLAFAVVGLLALAAAASLGAARRPLVSFVAERGCEPGRDWPSGGCRWDWAARRGNWSGEVEGVGATYWTLFVVVEAEARAETPLSYEVEAVAGNGAKAMLVREAVVLRSKSVQVLAELPCPNKPPYRFEVRYSLAATAAVSQLRFSVLGVNPKLVLSTVIVRAGLALVAAVVWAVCSHKAPALPEQRALSLLGAGLVLFSGPQSLLRLFFANSLPVIFGLLFNFPFLVGLSLFWTRVFCPLPREATGRLLGFAWAAFCVATTGLLLAAEVPGGSALQAGAQPALTLFLASGVAVSGVLALLGTISRFEAVEERWEKLSSRQCAVAALTPACLALAAGCGLWEAAAGQRGQLRAPLLLQLPVHAYVLLLQLSWARREESAPGL